LGGASEWTWKFIILKVVGLALLLIVLAGGVRWWKYFTRIALKSYFHDDTHSIVGAGLQRGIFSPCSPGILRPLAASQISDF
jgi:hypothetical protein